MANGHGLTIQARKGYFAPKGQVSPEELAKNEISEAVHSSYPIQDLPLTFETEVRKEEAQNADIAVQARLDIRNLPFEKKGDRNLDNLVLAVALFDRDGKYVSGSQMTYSLALKDSTLAEMAKSGLGLKAHVLANPGAYTVRVVVRDARGGKMAALSKAVEVPSQTAPPAAPPAALSGPAVARDSKGGEMASLNKATEAPSRTAPPEAPRVVPSGPPPARESKDAEMAAANRTTEALLRTFPPSTQLIAPADEPFFEAYRHCDPITKWPLKKTPHEIRELKGLEPATDQSQLPEILRHVSKNLQKFVTNFVNIVASETVDETENWPFAQRPKRIVQKFRYLMLARKEGEALTLIESRTDLRGREAPTQKLSKQYVKTTGFAAMPLFFGPLQQPWSDFRLLGQQKIGRDRTEVVAFAEHAEPVAVMGHFLIGGTSVPLLVQGVAWIRSSDYQILQMRTDLLASMPPLIRMTTVVHFAETQFQDSPTALWLPKEVEVTVKYGQLTLTNRHRYSHYQMFRVKSAIKPG